MLQLREGMPKVGAAVIVTTNVGEEIPGILLQYICAGIRLLTATDVGKIILRLDEMKEIREVEDNE